MPLALAFAAMLFDLAALDEATALVRRHMPATAQYAWPLLAAELGHQVWVKHENHTPTGAFKMRGGLVYLDRMCRERPASSGVVSATRGNHGQSLGFAGRAMGVPVTIVVPEGNSPDKNASMAALGVELVVHGHDFQAAADHAHALAGERGLEFVPSFHPDLVRGVATYARELFDGAAPLDVVVAPIGMGSGICGLITVRDLLGLSTRIYGVVSSGAPAYALSVAAGAVVSTERADTFVDGVACRIPDPTALSIIAAGVAGVVTVDDDAVADAMRVLHRTTHNMVEPAGAISLAGLRALELPASSVAAVVMSGGNLDASILEAVLAGVTPTP